MTTQHASDAALHELRQESQHVIHDLRSPLQTILLNLDFLERSAHATQRHDAIADIRASALHALRIVENLLELVRLERGRAPVSEIASPNDVARAVVERRRATSVAHGVQLTVRDESARQVRIDPLLLARVLDNLLDNAFRHTPRFGRVELAVRDEPDHVRIAIGNTGAAIPEQQRESVFERAGGSLRERAERFNLGLGLPFCRRAVTAMGGTLHVESCESLPTVFVITLPS